MAKHITVSKAEHEYMLEMIANDGLTIAKLEAELAQAKEDIRRLLIIGTSRNVCQFCKITPADCEDCETCAEWRGHRSDVQT